MAARPSSPTSRSGTARSQRSVKSPAAALKKSTRAACPSPPASSTSTPTTTVRRCDSHLAPSSWHGVTTVVMGNCGVGFAPVRRDTQDKVVALMEGVEDLPGPCLNEGLDWNWESFAEYLTALERRRHDIDFCALLPHAPMRVYVMGDRAMALEDANQEDIARMREITAEAIRAGAFGFSTS